MINLNYSYPYPILRPDTGDYLTSTFVADMRVEPDEDGFLVIPSFSVTNDEVLKLISEGVLSYAVEVSCPSTWFRKLYEVYGNKTFFLPAQNVHDTVELKPAIISKNKIENYYNDDFAGAYNGKSFDIDANSVVGIGYSKTFLASYKDDLIKDASSIISVIGEKKNQYIVNKLEEPTITVVMPEEQFAKYKEIGAFGKEGLISILNAVIAIPALVEALVIMRHEEDPEVYNKDHAEYNWYKSLRVLLKQYSDNDDGKYYKLLEEPTSTAQMLLNNNSERVIDYVVREEA